MKRSTRSILAGYQRHLLVLCFLLVSPGFAYASYTFSLVGTTATVSPVAATGGPILIDSVLVGGTPYLEWSVDNGATFSLDWDSTTAGVQMLPAATTSTINLTLTTGAGSSITLGDTASPASSIFASVNLGPVGAPANSSLVIDDSTSTQAAGSYDFFYVLGSISGPGGAAGGINFSSFGPLNAYTVMGGPAGNTFNIHSTFNATITSTTIIGGTADTVNVTGDVPPGIGTPLTLSLGGGANTVNIGSLAPTLTGGTLAAITAQVSILDPLGFTAVNIDDSGDSTGRTVTVGGGQITGLTTTAIQYNAAELFSLVINGGTGSDAFTVAPSLIFPITINGGPPLPPAVPGDSLTIDLSGVVGTTLSSTCNSAGCSGSYKFADGHKKVAFSGIETLSPSLVNLGPLLPVPTLSEWMIVVLSLALGLIGLARVRCWRRGTVG